MDWVEGKSVRGLRRELAQVWTADGGGPSPLEGQSPYPMDSDYVFASPTMKGNQPHWPDNLVKRYIKPVARKAGINKNIGWHTFRHPFGTLLKANGVDVETVQELLRHANSRITLDVYTQALNSNKRATQSKVVRMMVSESGSETRGRIPAKSAVAGLLDLYWTLI
jgi:integrase